MSGYYLGVGMSSLGLMILAAAPALSQDYPNRPVRIVTNQPGGGGDIESRIIRETIAGRLGQPVIVENRPGNLIGGIVARALPDGYTLLIAGPTMAFGPLLGKTDYDTLKDFSPISSLGSAPNVLVVHPGLPVNSVKELIALAKAKPGVLNYSTAATGSSYHLAGELFKSLAGVNIVRVPYVGGGPTITAVIGGEVQLSFGTAATVIQHVKSGRLKALAHSDTKPSALAPGVPTMVDSGLPGYQFVSVDFISAPAKTPAAIIKRLNQEIVRALGQPEVKEKLLNSGVEAAASSPEELGTSMKSEYAKVGKLIKDAGITAN